MIGMGWLQDFLNLSNAEFDFVACLLLNFPLAYIHRTCFKTAFQRHLFSLLVGLFFSYTLFQTEALLILIPVILSYYIMKYGPQNYAHIVVFVFNIAWVAIGHIYTIYTHYLEFTAEWTGTFMMLMIRLTSTAYNYYDGRKSEEEFNLLSPDQKYQAFKELPSLFEFLSYNYFFSSFSCGPPTILKEYLAFTDRTIFKDEKDGAIPTPWSWNGVGKRFFYIGISIIYNKLADIYPVDFIFKKYEVFVTWPFWHKFFYIYFTTQCAFYKYIFIWYMSEAACVFAGYGFRRDKAGVVHWDGMNMINFYEWYTAENGTGISKNWNVQGARWLKNTIYLRMVARKHSRLSASLATFTVSAVWHGFYPGYYFSFISFALVDASIKILEKFVRPHFVTYTSEGKEVAKPNKFIYNFFVKIMVNLTFFYMANPFMMFTMENVIKCWSSVYYFWHFFYLFLALFFIFFGKYLPRGSVRPKKTN
eukprot:TRINITY_DN4070_c0_g1_i1.p1 TRINITY_DN4070_c0_g1~~TRINITY_DN4070_c0_g1_i1.p1  ORF type:complete len:475 (-),score=93.07 TRINITY_DN4070_c0_g1_i1:45-1469(-)